MTSTKKLGIWMDHSSAHLIEFNHETIETAVIHSDLANRENLSSSHNEDVIHNKEKQLQAGYFKKLSESIGTYDEVLLFGPTNAKSELYNILKDDHHFDKIKFEIKQSDKLTENQQHAFVKEHFMN